MEEEGQEMSTRHICEPAGKADASHWVAGKTGAGLSEEQDGPGLQEAIVNLLGSLLPLTFPTTLPLDRPSSGR